MFNMASPAMVSKDREVMSGALVFSGTRVPVSVLFEFLEQGNTLADFFEAYPTVSIDHVKSVLHVAFEELERKYAS